MTRNQRERLKLVCNLPPGTRAALKVRSDLHHRSVEAEVREILSRELEREPVALVDLLTGDVGSDVDF
ncbi:FitA-like ribbon-helix-helix domain-containing protein [Gordonia amarae]|uniref:FitA-like ribbon-helix-helix domain-containing protein n=1 Tax=Gordonia amarae TaxID=36821 RepID=UPI0009FBDD3D|nr:antitoxin [Gordonia amarae]